MSAKPSVLYDAPGPRGRAVNLVASLVGLAVLLWVAWVVFSKFDDTGQWAAAKWKPFLHGQVWQNFLLPGIVGTLKAFALGSVLSLAFGVVLAVGRLSDTKPVRITASIVVEFFRSIPLLLLMMFLYYLQPTIGMTSNVFLAVSLGLMFYNGSVLAEVIRAGVHSLPRGQREAGLAIGLTQGQTLAQILLPQAIRAMLPAIVAQLVVVLKDTALGYILAYEELLNQLPKLGNNFHNLIPAAMVIAAIYIVLNSALGFLATWLERFLSRSSKGEPVAEHEEPLLSLPGVGMPGGNV